MSDGVPAGSEAGASTSRDRWFGVGSSTGGDGAAAGHEAAVEAMVGDDPKLVVVFCSAGLDLQAVVNPIAAAAPGVPMIGCTTAGEIATGAAGTGGVTVAVLGGDFSAASTFVEIADGDLFEAGNRAGAVVTQIPDREHTVVLLLTDGLAGNQQEVVRGVYNRIGAAVPLVGGCAGDDAAMVKTFQVCDGTVIENAVVAAVIGSDAPIGIGVQHGWRPVGEPMLVTSSGDTGVTELDGQPALDRYLDKAGMPAALKTDQEAVTTFAMTHPLGLRRRAAEGVRFITGADVEAGTLTSIAELPEGSLVWLMEGDRRSVLAGTTASCEDALDQLGANDPIGLLLFDCIARKTVLGPDGVAAEMETIGSVLETVPTAGFYTYGEFARTRGARGFHNQTLVALALS